MVSEDRLTWKGRIDFLLACLGFCIGLGNIWRFPYLCFFHGGAAFLIPYIIMTLILGLPLFFMELALGQFTSQGPVTSWGMNPLLSGIGWGMVLISTMTCIYYNVIVMYSFMYICLSLVNIGWAVPWASCDNDWNTAYCRDKPLIKLENIEDTGEKITAAISMKNDSCVDRVMVNLGLSPGKAQLASIFSSNYSFFEQEFSVCNVKYSLPSQEYWSNFILENSDEYDIGSIGGLLGRNSFFLLLTWIMIFVCLLRGPQSIAKVVYFSATYPLGILIVLLIRSITTAGYHEGVRFYLVPEWGRLLEPEVWSAAASQVLFSLGICYGGLIALASYNNFKNNIFRDAMVVATINMGTSIFGGFVTFSLIGSIAHETNRPMKELVQSGPDLLFVIYPLGLANLPSPAVWAFLFFLMVFTLGLDSQFAMMEAVIVGVTDRFPKTIGKHRIKFVAACCTVCFLLGLPLTTKGGIHVLTLFNWYAASYALIILSLLELAIVAWIYGKTAIVAWIYGVRNFIGDIEQMIGKRSEYFWRYWIAMWVVVTPIMLLFIFIMAMVSYSPAEYDGKTIPGWAEFLGWIMTLGPIFCVIGGAVNTLLVKKIPILEAIKPSAYWGPLDKEISMEDYVTVTEIQNPGDIAMIPAAEYRNIHDGSEPDGCSANAAYINTEKSRETYLIPSNHDSTTSVGGNSTLDKKGKSPDQTKDDSPKRCPSGASNKSENNELMV